MFLSGGTLVTKSPTLGLPASYFSHMPPMAQAAWPSAYSQMFRSQLWVYTVSTKLARAEARLPMPVYERDDQNRPRRDDHPMAQLLANPNPGMSGPMLWTWTRAMRCVHGEAFWLKKRGARGQVTALFPLYPTGMSYDSSSGTWEYQQGATRLTELADEDLVIFRNFNPDSMTRGMSPLEPLRATLENEWHARNATSSFWQNGARPGVALSHPGTLSQPAADRLKAQWDATAAGSGRTGSTVVLEEGMKPEVMTISAEEAQYIETRRLNREEVCAAFDVPPPVVHILDRATFSNITEQMRSMYRDTMAPLLREDEAAVELYLRRQEWPDDAVYAEFLMDDVLRGDFEARQAALAAASHMTIAEKRKVENLPYIDGTDRIFLNTATMPLDAIDAQAQAIAARTEAASDPLAEVIPLAAARAVMGRLSWQQSLDEVDLRTVTDGVDEAWLVKRALEAEMAAGGTVQGLRERVRAMSERN